MRGVLRLGTQPDMAIPNCFLAGQVLECLLKAYLSKKGTTEKELTKMGHKIQVLWEKSVQNGLPITSNLPQWAEDLNRLHTSPYNLRYPLTVNGLVLPDMQTMTSELEALLATIREDIQ
jgi:HEPN domain-containing protein